MFFCLQSSVGEIKNVDKVNGDGQKKKKKKLWRRTLEWHKLLCNFEERELVSKALILTEDL